MEEKKKKEKEAFSEEEVIKMSKELTDMLDRFAEKYNISPYEMVQLLEAMRTKYLAVWILSLAKVVNDREEIANVLKVN